MKCISFAVFTISFIFIFGISAEISACICNYPYGQKLTKEQELNWYRSKAQTVIVGKVINQKNLWRQISRNTWEDRGTRKTISVEQFWGSPVPKEVFLTEGLTSCDARLMAGESYLIFVYKIEGNKISTNRCSGNIKFPYAAEWTQLLGESSKPEATKPKKHRIVKRSIN